MKLRILRKCFHTGVTLMNAIGAIWSLHMVITASNELDRLEFVRHARQASFRILTLWVVISFITCFGLYTVIDILDLYIDKYNSVKNSQDRLHSIASYLLFSIVFPYTTVAFLLFWYVYLWNRELIYPADFEYLYPSWINHILHTFPVPLSVLYMVTSNKITPNKTRSFKYLIIFNVIYALMFLEFYFIHDKYIYLALHSMNPGHLIAVLSFAELGPIYFFFLGFKINEKLTSFGKLWFGFSDMNEKLENIKNS